MPGTDRFEKIYGAVTDDLRAYVEEEYTAGRISQFERRWFTRGLIDGFIKEFQTWPAPPSPDIARYLARVDPRHSDIRLAAHVFLHVGYDLPRVICHSFDVYPNVRESGRSVFVRPGPRFLKQFLVQMREGTFGLAARLIGQLDTAQALGYWLVALRSVAWIHGEVLADTSSAQRQAAEARMARALDEAAVEALKHRWIFGIEHLDNGQLTMAIPVIERSLTGTEVAVVTAAGAAVIGTASLLLRRRQVGIIDVLGAYVYRGMVRALDANLNEGQRFA